LHAAAGLVVAAARGPDEVLAIPLATADGCLDLYPRFQPPTFRASDLETLFFSFTARRREAFTLDRIRRLGGV
jgi:hypothetical protein